MWSLLEKISILKFEMWSWDVIFVHFSEKSPVAGAAARLHGGNLIFGKMDHGRNRLAGSLLAFPSKLVAIDVICKKCIERKVSQETSKVFH